VWEVQDNTDRDCRASLRRGWESAALRKSGSLASNLTNLDEILNVQGVLVDLVDLHEMAKPSGEFLRISTEHALGDAVMVSGLWRNQPSCSNNRQQRKGARPTTSA
jgi:hypothetical protein